VLTDTEHFYRRWYASVLIVCAFFSGVAGLYLTPVFMAVMVYLTVARRRHVLVDAALFAAGAAMMVVSAKFIGPALFSDWSAMMPAFDSADLLSWMFISLIAAKAVFFIGGAACLFSDVKNLRQGVTG
jgi:small neutral amino acid transporter SnatA (MarC family)